MQAAAPHIGAPSRLLSISARCSFKRISQPRGRKKVGDYNRRGDIPTGEVDPVERERARARPFMQRDGREHRKKLKDSAPGTWLGTMIRRRNGLFEQKHKDTSVARARVFPTSFFLLRPLLLHPKYRGTTSKTLCEKFLGRSAALLAGARTRPRLMLHPLLFPFSRSFPPFNLVA